MKIAHKKYSKKRMYKAGEPSRGEFWLERALSKLGIASRAQARRLILSGRIKVGDVCERNPRRLVTLSQAKLFLDDNPIREVAPKTILLYKPRGVVTTRCDEKGRPTVFSILKEMNTVLHAVGRLDMATSGLLILTNDTRLSSWLADPANQIKRVYVVTVKGKISESKKELLAKGIDDEGELLKAEKVDLRKVSNRESHLTVVLTEGKNREIRRMLKAIGHEVTRLKRVAFGGLTLGDLQPGQWRELTREEVLRAFPGVPTGPNFQKV